MRMSPLILDFVDQLEVCQNPEMTTDAAATSTEVLYLSRRVYLASAPLRASLSWLESCRSIKLT